MLQTAARVLLMSFMIGGLFFWGDVEAFTGGADDPQAPMDWWRMGMNLVGGLALFLFGMEQMADALKAVAGERMRLILAKLTTNRFLGAMTGAFVTAMIQSSSVTTVLVVGFITAGLMSMAQSIGVIMGANVGTTITAQIIAFKITHAALPMIAAGFATQFVSKHERVSQYGTMLMGLGLIFFGMGVMGDAMQPLRAYQPFLDLMAEMDNPIIGILVAAVFTGLVQSSSATTGIVIVMASQGFISLPAGIALAFGANVGTCVTALLAAIGKPREAVRAALVHVIFNLFGVLLWFGLIPHLAEFVIWMSPQHPELSGLARLGAETPRQIANAHTVFNIANTLIFIGFVAQFARVVEWLVPDKPLEEEAVLQAKYLDASLLDTPSLALDQARMEMGRMGERVDRMLSRILPAILNRNRLGLREVAKLDDEVDTIYGYIVTYLGKLSQRALTEKQTRDFANLMAAVNALENIGDIVETDMVVLGNKLIKKGVRISAETQKVLKGIHEAVTKTVTTALNAVLNQDVDGAREVINAKDRINAQIDAATSHEVARLVANEPKRLPAYVVEIDVIENQKRIYYFAKRMAKTVVEETDEHSQDAGSPGAAERITR